MKVVTFLQNPWSPIWAGKLWPRELWLNALRNSRSGQRLQTIEDIVHGTSEFWYDNANPVVVPTPDGVLIPDLQHMREVIKEQKPHLIVACGRVAEKAARGIWSGSLIAVPHPAHRLLTNELYCAVGYMIRRGFSGRIALRQMNGYYSTEQL